MATLPRVVIAAPASGQGKTTVATGLIAALSARGLAVSPHKVGPDYIDPGYHALAAGRPGRNLDPWLVGEDRIVPLLLRGALTPVPADIAVVEGVMGLHDGMSGRDDFASTAHVARLIDAPVILVVDVRSQARSAAALVLGMRDFDPRITLAGVVLNRVGSARHEAMVRGAIERIGVPVVGAIGRSETIVTPSRHLGLVPAAERSPQAVRTVRALGDLVAQSLDLDLIIDVARRVRPLAATAWDPAREVERVGSGLRIALAAGAAFTFSYAETAELLAATGAQVATFDPLHDPHLPEGTHGVIIGGGFPEEHAERLASNTSLLAELATFPGPIYAECAGLLYLCRSLGGSAMAGRLPATATMAPRLTLGYREAVAGTDSIVARAGETVRGHEFHRTVTAPEADPTTPAWSWDSQPHGFVSGTVCASYLHLNWAGRPSLASNLINEARAVA